ncbi:MAG: bifunctional phosphoribosylaminoimidazolecarboxamide formyltransferase/IMP cyclohydrolase [Ignavibacteria bacterium]|nr:bifunctional phosphoribosylaminoimidazolecarboxamide formyltransferase/IMP cyclohydrolase [Ignavibacteria bacterium]
MTPDSYRVTRALISVSDKTDIVDFAQKLHELGIEILSTGGTASLLREHGITVQSVSDYTGFPEIMDGRVKTLQPKIHGGLLGVLDNTSHQQQMSEHGIKSIDLLIVNLYPFEKTLTNPTSTHDDIVENIDIGGPAMVRAAAKNYKWTAVVVNPDRYPSILDSLTADKTISESLRRELAGEAFAHTGYYDSLIAGYFRSQTGLMFPGELSIPVRKSQSLRYGENPHQQAVLYGNFTSIFRQVHGKELSYNNIIDIDAAAKLSLEFTEPTVVIIKHTNPCGVGSGTTLSDAYAKAFATDTVSPFGGIIAVNRTIDLEFAQTVHSLFAEVLIAPDFTDEALDLLRKKRDRRLMTVDYAALRKAMQRQVKSVAGGLLVQTDDTELLDESALKTVTKREPTEDERAALMFAWRVAKHVKSNAIIYAAKDRTLAIGAGQMSRVDSARIAVKKAHDAGIDLTGSAVASDAFFPFADGLLQAVEAGATAVIQPGGSVRDAEVIAAADENSIAMMMTGMRHFRH